MYVEAVISINPEVVWGWISAGGLYVLFGILLACGLGLPIPEDVPLLIGGALIAAGRLDWMGVAIAAWLGVMGGDSILYWFSRRYGHNVSRLPALGRHITESRINTIESLFARYGFWVVLIGRMVAGVRAAMVVAAGTIRYGFAKFLLADGFGAVISGGFFIWLGYIGGKAILADVEAARFWIMPGMALAAAGGAAWWLIKRRRQPAMVPPLAVP